MGERTRPAHPDRRSAPGRTSHVEEVAALTQRLAVLLEAGVTPANAWHYLAGDDRPTLGGKPLRRTAESSNTGAARFSQSRTTTVVLATVSEAVSAGVSLDLAIAAAARACDPRTRQAWSAVAAAWSVAVASGAPVSSCLRQFSGALGEFGEIQRAVGVALSAPVMTARLMTILPLMGLALGSILGFDTLATLLTTAQGLLCLGSGGVLLVLANRWNAALVASATPDAALPGITLELMAVALGGGASIDRARRIAVDALALHRLSDTAATGQLAAVIQLSRRAGVPAAELLRAEGAQSRRASLTASRKRAATLAVKLTVPLGLCVLPAFMLLGVAPLVISVISATFAQPVA